MSGRLLGLTLYIDSTNDNSWIILERLLMKTFLSLLFTMICLTLSAQQYKYVAFPDSNAVWSEIHWKPIFDPEPLWVYKQYALFNEDTVINGISYHKLFLSNSASKITRKNSICVGGIREDSLKRVFANSSLFRFVPEIKEVLLYDFSLKEGDTFYANYKEGVCTNCTGFQNGGVVYNIDTIKIYNHYRKVFILNNNNRVTWIEGIGNLQGLLECWPDWPTNGIKKELICMHQNDTLMLYNDKYGSCIPQFVIDGVALLPNTDIRVYPNPAKGGKVYFDNLEFETLELFDSGGKLLMQNTVKGTDCYELDVTKLYPGSYYYLLKAKGLVPTKGKLVIQ